MNKAFLYGIIEYLMEHKAYKVVYIKEILLNYYCNYLSLSSNLIYGIHCSYYIES